MTIFGKVNSAAHRHQLHLECKNEAYTCDRCQEVGFGKRYACSKDCDFHLHQDCANPHETITHPFFKGRVFEFSESGGQSRYCDACGWDIKGCYYRCGCGKDLHPCCATMKDINRLELKLVLKKKLSSRCWECGRKDLDSKRKTWAYVSEDKEYCLHVYCVKKKLLERCERIFLGIAGEVGEGNELALVERNSGLGALDLSTKDKKGGRGRFSKVKKVLQLVFAVIVAVIVGDPAAMLVGVVSNLITH